MPSERAINNFTYSPGEDTDLARVRITIDDIHDDDKLFDDNEITLFLTIEGDVAGAAAMAAETMVARFARDFDFTSDDTTVKRSQRVKHWADLAARLRSVDSGLVSMQTYREDGWQGNRQIDHGAVS